MKDFRNILFVSHRPADETNALKQAMSLARNNEARLTAQIISPALTDSTRDSRKLLSGALADKLKVSINEIRDELKIGGSVEEVSIKTEGSETPGISIIRQVLRNNHDLVIKEAEPRESGKGFQAVDMQLLRKCPCPVWLSKPIMHSRTDMKVSVAIDPMDKEEAGRNLALQLLQTARSLADQCSGTLEVVSCWYYHYQESVRNNPWLSSSQENLSREIADFRSAHLNELNAIIKESGIDGDIQIHHLEGNPESLIPAFVKNNEIDILVMGTLARTGISGFLMGNTAENILQELKCSVLAQKPNGFVSPVKV